MFILYKIILMGYFKWSPLAICFQTGLLIVEQGNCVHHLQTVLILSAGSGGIKASTAFPYFLLDMAVAGLAGEHQPKIAGSLKIAEHCRGLLTLFTRGHPDHNELTGPGHLQ